MDEKLFKKMKSVGAANLVCGIIAMAASDVYKRQRVLCL